MSRVLVIDDEPSYRKHLKRALSQDGYCVEVAANQDEALDLAPLFRPDVVVADWMLKSDLNGLQLAHRLLEENPDLRIIIITGFPTANLRSDVQHGAVFEFLEKPFRMDLLLNAVHRATSSES